MVHSHVFIEGTRYADMIRDFSSGYAKHMRRFATMMKDQKIKHLTPDTSKEVIRVRVYDLFHVGTSSKY